MRVRERERESEREREIERERERERVREREREREKVFERRGRGREREEARGGSKLLFFLLPYDLRRDQDVPGRFGALVDQLGEPQGRELLFVCFFFFCREQEVFKRGI